MADRDSGPNGGEGAVPALGPGARALEFLSTLSAFWILLLCAIYLYDIIGREAFNAPFLGTHEIVGNSIVGILFLELPASIRRGAMLRTTIIYDALGTRGRAIINGASYVLGIILFTAIILGGWDAMITSWRMGEIEGAGAFEVPVYPVRTVIIVMSMVCVAVYIYLLFLSVTGRHEPANA